ncbi:MAG: alpha-L-fucosidase [Kiritimatiellae bacterium]|nr:alpha-L-fucosidase [Kiritimatiellia bacterium]
MPLEEVASRIPHETSEETAARLSWWTEARFGMFIHFGLYAMPARHEWIRNYEEISNEDYEKYFERFDPDLFDAGEWARAAKAAGMKYVVLTTKHHEGFCMFDSKVTDYKITNTPFGRDLVAEFVEAVRAEGLKVGFYYSLLDWHHPDFTVDGLHPLRNGDVDKLNEGRDMARYRQYMKDQVTELLTNYGKIDIMWFDFSYPRNDKWGKGRDDWDSPGLLTLARTLQPGIIVDNRMDLNDVENGFDFMTPEQFKVTEWPTHNGRRHPWETCQTFSGSWGYFRDETSWKSDAQCLDLLISTVAHGGNLIMNVGPTARGEFDGRARERLDGYGRWMHANSRSIYGCTEAPEGFEAPEHSVLTYNPKTNRLYIHLFHYPAGQLGVKFGSRIAYAQFLHDGSEIQVKPMPDWQAKASDSTGYDSYLNFPVLKPAVEIPVIECYLK